MGEQSRATHPGTFSWADLATNRPAGAKAFYGGLFGWEFDDMPVGDGGHLHHVPYRRQARRGALAPARPGT